MSLEEIKRRTAERKAAGVNQTYLEHAVPVSVVGDAPKVDLSRFSLPVCTHQKEDTGETRQCPTCNGSVRVKVFGCEIHGTCTVSKLVSGVQCCRICPDYAPG